MRPVNLIPPEERRGESAPTRTGVLAYAIVGVLVVAVAVVAAVTLLGNQIDDRNAEVARLEAGVQQSEARATALAPYTSLAQVKEARTVTIDSLAKSRFDWERVLRELSRVTPSSIALSGVTGTATPDVTVDGGADVSLRADVAGPALEIVGCAQSQRKLAEFIASLHDIDGVTRVAAKNGIRPQKSDQIASSTEAAGGCARQSDSAFEIVAAFDAIPTPTEPDVSGAAPVAASASTGTASDGGVASAQQQQAQQQQEISNASARSDNATNLVPGG